MNIKKLSAVAVLTAARDRQAAAVKAPQRVRLCLFSTLKSVFLRKQDRRRSLLYFDDCNHGELTHSSK